MKRIFYYTDVLPFLSRDAAAIRKLEKNLETFKEASGDISLVWHPWSKTTDYLNPNKSKVVEDYQRVVDNYVNEGWGELDIAGSLQAAKEVLFSCDAYYGDASDLAYEAQLAGMPVMLQNIDI